MTGKKNEAVAMAQKLYMMADSEGKHANSLQVIAKLLQENLEYCVDVSTISRWANQNGWKTLFEQGRKLGVAKQVEAEMIRGLEVDEAYEEAVGDATAKIFKNEFQIYETSSDLLRLALKKMKETVEADPEQIIKLVDIRGMSNVKQEALKALNEMLGIDKGDSEDDREIDELYKEFLEKDQQNKSGQGTS